MSRLALLKALAHEGVPVEAAARIMVQMFGPDAPIEPSQFAPEDRGGYVIRAESFSGVLRDLVPLHVDHYLETEKYRQGITLNPDYPAMVERERAGRLLQITARHEGKLIGHVRMYIQTSLHTRTVFADEDTLYVHPDHRGTYVAIRLMRYAERCLLALGIREIRANSKLINRADVLMRRLGYPAVATLFCKIFSAQEAALHLARGEPAHELPP